MNRVSLSIIAVAAAVLTGPGAAWADWKPAAYRSAYVSRGPNAQQLVSLRREMAAAQRDLARATASAGVKTDELKQAEQALARARREHFGNLAAARKHLADDPAIGMLRKQVAAIESRMRDQTDPDVRLTIAGELMTARSALAKAESEVLGVDPDLALSKAAVDDAAKTLRQAQSAQQSQIQQDPAVLAAKQRVVAVQQQMRRR